MSFLSSNLPVEMNLMADTSLPNWVSPIITAWIIICFSLYYSVSIKRARSYSDMSSVVLLTFLFLQWIAKTSNQILGKAYKAAVPFFIYLIFYFWIGGVISIMGFPTLAASIEIPATIAIVVLIGTVAIGIYCHRWGYFGDYIVWVKYRKKRVFPIPDPLKFIGEISKVVSLSCRMWGNCLASSIILFVCYFSINNLFTNFSMSWASILVIPTVVFPLHIYFDIVEGGIQALIFMLLTISYWAIATQTHSSQTNHGSK